MLSCDSEPPSRQYLRKAKVTGSFAGHRLSRTTAVITSTHDLGHMTLEHSTAEPKKDTGSIKQHCEDKHSS